MKLEKLDHVAIEVVDLDYYVAQLVGTGGMRLLRRAIAKRTGTRMAMVGDPTGMKLELIENKDAATGAPRFLHVAFRSSDVDAAVRLRLPQPSGSKPMLNCVIGCLPLLAATSCSVRVLMTWRPSS